MNAGEGNLQGSGRLFFVSRAWVALKVMLMRGPKSKTPENIRNTFGDRADMLRRLRVYQRLQRLKGTSIITSRKWDCNCVSLPWQLEATYGALFSDRDKEMPKYSLSILFALAASLLRSCFPASHCLTQDCGDSGGQQPASTCQICGFQRLARCFPQNPTTLASSLPSFCRGSLVLWA